MSRNKLLLEPLASARHSRQTALDGQDVAATTATSTRSPYPGTTWGHSRYNAASSCASELLFVNCSSGRHPPARQCADSRRRFHRCAPHRILSIAERKPPGTLACLTHNE